MKNSKKKWFVLGGVAVALAGIVALVVGIKRSFKGMFVPDEEFYNFDLEE